MSCGDVIFKFVSLLVSVPQWFQSHMCMGRAKPDSFAARKLDSGDVQLGSN